jgi:hypothetical protein
VVGEVRTLEAGQRTPGTTLLSNFSEGESMPSLSDAQRPRPAGYEPVEQRPMPPVSSAATEQNLQPGQNPNMRCPVPMTNFTVDASRQFYRGNTIPQYRTYSPPQLTGVTGSGGGTTINNSVNTGGGGTTIVTTALKTLSASTTTPVLNPRDIFTATMSLARVYRLISLSATSPARVRVYATAQAQTLDLIRKSGQALAYGTTQGVVADISLDTTPETWLFTPIPTGANGDNPTSSAAYVSITNISSSSLALSVSFTYVQDVA